MLAQAVEPLGIAGGEARRHVLRDQHRRRVGRQLHQHRLGRLGAAGGGADEDRAFRSTAGPIAAMPAVAVGARRRSRCCARWPVAAPARCAATRILSVMSSASRCRPSATPIFGLATKSTAPSSSARSVTSAPRSVSVTTITTGIGRSRIRLEEVEAVHARHLDVERDHVGVERCGSSRAPPADRPRRRRTACRLWRLMISAEQARAPAPSRRPPPPGCACACHPSRPSSEQIDRAAAGGCGAACCAAARSCASQRVGVGRRAGA